MERLEILNDRLIDHFGRDIETGKPIFRIVWSDDQTEKIKVDETEAGVQLLFPEVREVKKYSYIQHLYVLEQLVVVPKFQQGQMLDVKLSYEPLWAYCDQNKNPLPPLWSATKFIIDTLYAARGHKSLRKYIDDEKNTTEEGREQRVSELQMELFGNETATSDALRYKQGIVVPSTYNMEN